MMLTGSPVGAPLAVAVVATPPSVVAAATVVAAAPVVAVAPVVADDPDVEPELLSLPQAARTIAPATTNGSSALPVIDVLVL